jgi:hypothetical protein
MGKIMMEYRSWTRRFWIALKPDAGQSTLRFDAFQDGTTLLEMVGTVDGRGLLLRWLSADHAVVTVRSTPYGSPDVRLDREQTPVSTQDDPDVSAAQARQRLAETA